LDIGCFNLLKRIYGKELEVFIKNYINYIIKIEFFIVFYITYNNTMFVVNVLAEFRRVGLILFNLKAVILKFNIKL